MNLFEFYFPHDGLFPYFFWSTFKKKLFRIFSNFLLVLQIKTRKYCFKMKILNILKPSNLTRGSLNFTPFFPFSNKVDPSKNWYKVLQVDKSATPEDIKKSYYNLAKKYHPDVNKGSDEHFKEINTAYEILSNEDSRRNFDHFLAGDRYSSSVQNKYSSYHYGYNMRGKSRHSKANENYYGSSQKDNEQFYYQAYSYKKKNDYEKRKWEQFYSDDKENRGPTYDDLNVGRREYVFKGVFI